MKTEYRETIIEVILSIIYILTAFLSGIFILVHIYSYLFPRQETIFDNLLSIGTASVHFFTITMIALLFVAIILFYKVRQKPFRIPKLASAQEMIVVGISSYFASLYLIRSLPILSPVRNFPLVQNIMTLVFIPVSYVFIIHIIEFYTKYEFKYVTRLIRNIKSEYALVRKTHNLERVKKFAILLTPSVFKLSLVAVVIMVMAVFIIGYSQDEHQKEKKLRESLHISNVTPYISTYGNKVTIEGYNFGWKLSKNDYLKTEDGPLTTDVWTDSKIQFTVPFHVREGKLSLQVVRMKDPNISKRIIRSNIVLIDIRSRWEFYPTVTKTNSLQQFVQEKVIKRLKRYYYLDRDLKKLFGNI